MLKLTYLLIRTDVDVTEPDHVVLVSREAFHGKAVPMLNQLRSRPATPWRALSYQTV